MQTQNEYTSVTPSPVRANRRLPIREGDKFKCSSGEVWTITEVGLFGSPHWVVSADRNRQAMFQRATLERMERV